MPTAQFSDDYPEEEMQRMQAIRERFEARVLSAYKLRNKPGERTLLYQRWRKEHGDAIAKESAKFAEALIFHEIPWPKWFKAPPEWFA